VKISTDAAIVGWGEMLKDDAKACAAGALEVGDCLVGQHPCRSSFIGRRFNAALSIAATRPATVSACMERSARRLA